MPATTDKKKFNVNDLSEGARQQEISKNPGLKAGKLGLKQVIHHLGHHVFNELPTIQKEFLLSPLNKALFAASFTASFIDETNKGKNANEAFSHALKHAAVEFIVGRATWAIPGIGQTLMVCEILAPLLERGQTAIFQKIDLHYEELVSESLTSASKKKSTLNNCGDFY